ncbi:AAEL004408-PA [Aedes aegypti]|uniref:AAEL004408-PA n=1 Tax=Aedes aegypti TaxID=7159 RepID=Q17CW5_AEDAE|nr:AAEL004408-PA [Aedes aegypti]
MAFCNHPKAVDTGAAKRHSSSHSVNTAISAASQVDGNQQKQAFLLLLAVEASQVADAVAVK